MATSEFQAWLRRHGVDSAFTALAELYPHAVVFAVDAQNNVIYWNDEAERQLGYRREEMLGAHCLKGVRCPDCVSRCVMAADPAPKGLLTTCHTRDGAALSFRRSARALHEADGTFSGGIELLLPADPSPAPVAEPLGGAQEFGGLVTRDPVMLRAFQTIRNVAATEATVLLRGESGTGKELVARALHAESHRARGPFVAVNCASLSPTLVESELFGHVRGAFTGAAVDRVGLFAQANGGTLFLDEVAELSLDVQAKLLRVLQERSFTPVGASKLVHVDVRIIAATHRALREEVRAGRFREDLMYRLRVVPLFLPPLRERRSDVELLLTHFIQAYNRRGPRHVHTIAPEAMKLLLDHSWPGNVREVQNVIEYAFAVGRGPEIQLDELPPEFRESPRARVETIVDADGLRDALARAHGHVGKAAALLGVSRPTFWRWRRRLGV